MIVTENETPNLILSANNPTGFYTPYPTQYQRLATREVNVGGLLLGNYHPIRVQTMTTTDTMDTIGTVEQTIRCIKAGAELVRITAPSKKEAENLSLIKKELHSRGYYVPLVADIHFTPNAAEVAARIVEKVRVNPGNYVDKKKFELIEYTDADYAEEIERIQERFTPLVKICKEYGTAMRIGTNHGSLSDRIMSRYGDTPMGMVESAMEFLRIARYESYHNIVLSMKSSNPQVMVQAYRLLVATMQREFGENYPLHLGVTEAGDGEDGRIKSAVGIGTLLEDGIGDTIRVSLTEDPELELPVCRDLVRRYQKDLTPRPPLPETSGGGWRTQPLSEDEPIADGDFPRGQLQAPSEGEGLGGAASTKSNNITQNSASQTLTQPSSPNAEELIKSAPATPSTSLMERHSSEAKDGNVVRGGEVYKRRTTSPTANIGGTHVPVVIADLSKLPSISPQTLESIGYKYNALTDKWTITDAAADYIFTGTTPIDFALPGTLKVIMYADAWKGMADKITYLPIHDSSAFALDAERSEALNFVMVDCTHPEEAVSNILSVVAASPKTTSLQNGAVNDPSEGTSNIVLCLSSTAKNAMQNVRGVVMELVRYGIQNPVVLIVDSHGQTADEHLIHYATEAGALLLDGIGDGVCFGMTAEAYQRSAAQGEGAAANASGRNYLHNKSPEAFINNTAFGILQATRTRISKTEYISCPSCGRTLFELQETTAKIRAVTHHLKGVKIAIMGCIVNGPGEMADADFGYVGSGVGKITLYKGREIVKRNVPSEVAVDELISLMKESEVWVEKEG